MNEDTTSYYIASPGDRACRALDFQSVPGFGTSLLRDLSRLLQPHPAFSKSKKNSQVSAEQ